MVKCGFKWFVLCICWGYGFMLSIIVCVNLFVVISMVVFVGKCCVEVRKGCYVCVVILWWGYVENVYWIVW